MTGPARGLCLDTGALLALERGDARMRELLRAVLERDLPVAVVAPVVAQAWRGGPRQASVARFLALPEVDIAAMDADVARAVGVLCGRSGHPDVVDVHVALHARLHDRTVVTSDPEDLLRADPATDVIAI